MRIFLLLFLLWAIPSHAVEQQFAWAPSANPAPTGYRLYYGTVSSTYTDSVDVGLTLVGKITGLTEGVTYYVIVVGYNTLGESLKSNEVSFTAVNYITRPAQYFIRSVP